MPSVPAITRMTQGSMSCVMNTDCISLTSATWNHMGHGIWCFGGKSLLKRRFRVTGKSGNRSCLTGSIPCTSVTRTIRPSSSGRAETNRLAALSSMQCHRSSMNWMTQGLSTMKGYSMTGASIPSPTWRARCIPAWLPSRNF